jgi:hypothetical protein
MDEAIPAVTFFKGFSNFLPSTLSTHERYRFGEILEVLEAAYLLTQM